MKSARLHRISQLALNRSVFGVFFFLLLLGTGAHSVLEAQSDQVNADSEYDPADTSSPRATLTSFIEATNEFYQITNTDFFFDRTSDVHLPTAMKILDCFDTRDIAKFERIEKTAEIAICLKEILDRVDLPKAEDIPGPDEVAQSNENRVTRWKVPGTRITIELVEEGARQGEYLFSRHTVDNFRDYYDVIKKKEYRTTGPATSPGFYEWYTSAPGHPTVAKLINASPNFVRNKWGGLPVWKWIGMLCGMLLAIGLMGLLYWLLFKLGDKYQSTLPFRYCLTIILPIVAAMIPLGFLNFAHYYLTFRGQSLYIVSFACYAITLLCLVFVVFGLGNRIATLMIMRPKINPRGLDAQFIKILSKLSSIIAAALLLLEGGRFLGIPLTTLLASAGVGGIAVALAVQDTLKNVFGTIMLLSDKPFRVGDRIIFGRFDGFVEDIGLRSTSIRLLTGSQAIIPNDELARADIENVGRRNHIRQTMTIELPVDTTSEKLTKALEIVKSCIENHQGMNENYPPRVFLKDMSRLSLAIEVTYWYHPPEYWEFMAFNEEITLKIFHALQKEEIVLAKVPALAIQMSESVAEQSKS